MKQGLLLLAIVSQIGWATVPFEPLISSAEFYFSNREYKNALELWQRVLKADPAHPRAGLRVLELKLLVEGREALRDAAVLWIGDAKEVPADLRRAGRDRLHTLQTTFLTDQGQTIFYQALPRLERADCNSALPLLEQANQFEKGNTRVLKEKAWCERKTESYSRMLDSLRTAQALDPYDRWFADELAESEIFQGEYAALVQRLGKESLASLSERQKLALAVAFYERDDELRTGQILVHLKEGWGTHIPPVAYYLWSKLDKSEDGRAVARFEAVMKKIPKPTSTTWDPYRLHARLEAK